jgi:hypothetical protein
VTNPGGEINTLDPGGYGTVVITKAISIVSGLGEAGVLVPSGGTGITVNAGPNDKINLRGLIIEGAGVGGTGILFSSGGNLTITNAVIRNLLGTGLALAPNVPHGSISQIAVTNTIVSDTAGDGLYIQPTGSVTAVLNRVEAYNNAQVGIAVYGNLEALEPAVQAICIDCVAGNNGQSGFRTVGNGHGNAQLRLFRSVAYANFQFGISVESSAIAGLSQSHIEANFEGPAQIITGGQLFSYGDNYAGSSAILSTLINPQ